MESRNRFVFCEACVDFVYDHGLERLCGTSGKFEYQGEPQAPRSHHFVDTASDHLIDGKGRWAEDSASEVYVKNNALKNPCSRRGARGVWNMGQTCYQAVILQALLHDPILTGYFLAGGHDIHTCTRAFCMACAATEIFMEFNSGEKTEAVSAATLLYHGWDASRVRLYKLMMMSESAVI